MVFFSCEGCNETLKKAQVENHIRRCGCPVSCVDCSKVFPAMTYAQHTSCISEAEKYEKSLYKGPKGGGKKKRDPQAEWMDLIGSAAAEVDAGSGGDFSPLVKGSLRRMADLGNVPRNEKKFKNFLSNSLRIHRPQEQDELWQFLRKRAEAAANAAAAAGGNGKGAANGGAAAKEDSRQKQQEQNGHAAKQQQEQEHEQKQEQEKTEPRSSDKTDKKKKKKEKRKEPPAMGQGETKSGPAAEPAAKKQKQKKQDKAEEADEAASSPPSAAASAGGGDFAWEKTIKKLVKAASKKSSSPDHGNADGGGIGYKALQSQMVALALAQQQGGQDKKALKKVFKAKVAATPGVVVLADGSVAYAKEKKGKA